MSASHFDDLVARLNAGDALAFQEITQVYGPYLRMLIRRRLRPAQRTKFDSTDVVQSVWADVLSGVRRGRWHFEDRPRLEAFLARVARNRYLDRCRKYKTALALEEPLDKAGGMAAPVCELPRPSETAQGEDLWDQLLALCPPTHHELLRLKRQGLQVVEISSRTGLHEGSVRRIFYDLARKYAAAVEHSNKVARTLVEEVVPA